MIIASITRGSGDLVISTELHPKTNAPMVVLAHVRADETISCRAPLQQSELKQVIAALQVAVQVLTAKPTQHRTISAADQIAEDGRLF